MLKNKKAVIGLMCGAILINALVYGAIAWVIVHFVRKYW